MPSEPTIGWDIGGAHLKAARLGPGGRVERVVQVPCALWRGLAELERSLDAAESVLGPAPAHAVTMTGEMVDLFASRADGVARLVEVMRKRVGDRGLRFYAGTRGLVAAAEGAAEGLRLASANWLAGAEMVAACLAEALFVDIGSTTTDLIPVRSGQVRAHAADDAGRLVSGELVYTGVVRTPVMALAREAPFGGESVPLVAELFATTADVHRLCGRLPADADLHPAADGGEKTETGSARRLARMIGRDAEALPLEDWRSLARWLAEEQLGRIEHACALVLSREGLVPEAPVVAAGVGRFLTGTLAARLGRPVIEFAALLPEPGVEPGRVSDCAPAVAVAWLSQARGGAAPPRG
ncbi:MAG TPA: hydantoinase/oxoprolinase family protein [Gemmatimonadales bacterium]|nr:hydantoinase/oxoprolinase family protein [Gemmatimonadales bacterium]